jgi:branched-chain amino acid aminotransferase
MLNERVAFVNGEFVPESRATISIHDLGFVYGDAVYDTARTFAGKLFKLPEHIERLYQTLRYARIDPGMTPQQMAEKTEEVVRRNLPLLNEGDDFWVTQRVSRGLARYEGDPIAYEGATVVIECVPLPFKGRAHYFRDGIPVATPSVRRIAPEALSPRAKTTNYLNMTLGDLEVKARDPKLWAVLLDHNGNLCEGIGANIFLVRGGVVMTPKEDHVLPGISRATVIELCRQLAIPIEERDLAPHDAYIAQECFLTSTSLCLCPVSAFNDVTLPTVPGPVTKRLIDAYAKLVGLDFVKQYTSRL